jgi:hypothetical protein
MKQLLLIIMLLVCPAAWGLASPPDFAPQTTPLPPPETGQVNGPTASPTAEYQKYERERGLFNRSLDAKLNALYLYNRSGQQGLFGLVGGGCNLIIHDPYKLGGMIGLAEDALEYETGLGLVLGNGINSQALWSLPLNLGATLYGREKTLFGQTPFAGAALALNLFGTNNRSGGMGFQFYGGLESDPAMPGGRTALTIGYGSYRLTDGLFAEGLFFSLSQPVRL